MKHKSTLAPVLLLTGCRLSPAQKALLAPTYAEIIELPQVENTEHVFTHAARATDYILGGPEYIDAGALSRMPHLKRIVLLGTGIPSFIDWAAAQARGLRVLNTPHINATSVAEFTLAQLVLNAAGAIASADRVRAGDGWPQQPWKSLAEQRIGILGMGHIGRAVLEKLSALGVTQVGYASRSRKLELEQRYGACFMSRQDLLRECDSVCLHLSYSAQTHHIIDQLALQECHPDLQLLCFANPRVIDPAAARRALLEGRLRRLYIDGYYREWHANRGQHEDPEGLLALPRERFWATSHLAAQTETAIARQLALALELLQNGPVTAS